MYYRLAIDTFHFGLRCNFSDVDSIFLKIKKILFFNPVPEKSKNPYYLYGWQYPEVGFNVYFEPKHGLLNPPISVELNGRFFRMSEYSEKFVNWIFKNFLDILDVQRCDCCVDCIYEDSADYDKVSGINPLDFDYLGCCFSYGFPIPSIKREFKYNIGSLEGHFDLSDGGMVSIDLISSGRGQKKLRVYDKDKDIAQKDKGFTYEQLYNLKACRVFRIEYALRSDSVKTLFKKYNIKSVEDCIFYVLSAMFKRYQFRYVDDLAEVFKADVSFYSKKVGENLDAQICDCLNKLRKQTNRYVVLNQKKLREKCQEIHSDSLFDKNNYLKQIDFYEAYETLNKEGIY